MGTAKRDFEQFVSWLHDPANQAPPNVRRLANLCLENFDALEATAPQHNNRSAYIAGLARPNFEAVSDALPEIPAAAIAGEWPWRRLRHLTVGPFRGFRTPEPFDLQKRIVLFYGPNGSGKTSLCEALEYALLGSVAEADAKRIESAAYLVNEHEQNFAAPALIASNVRNQPVNVDANADTFRFCFIEKNRIDAFSRIAARPAAQRTELIATLFGMDKFNEFVSRFNEQMDAVLVLTREQQFRLAARRSALQTDTATVAGEAQALQTQSDAENALGNAYQAGMDFASLNALWTVVPEQTNRLQELAIALDVQQPPVYGVARQAVQESYNEAKELSDQLKFINDLLASKASEVSFKDLYTAVLELQPGHSEYCPACDTPIKNTSQNPYELAQKGLADLGELAALQASKAEVTGRRDTAAESFHSQLNVLLDFLVLANEVDDTVLGRYIDGNTVLHGTWSASYFEPRANAEFEDPSLYEILALVDRVADQDTNTRQLNEVRQPNVVERDRINEYRLRAQAQDTARQQLVTSIQAARLRVEAFDQANAQLITDVATEAANLLRDTPIKTAYDRFLVLLRRYRDQLPGTLMAGLNNLATDLYNSFNRTDQEADKLAALHLPMNSNQIIQLSFRGNPEARVDALRILSEGHVRCLGLAILLAKAQSLGAPIIVFDDAINAIDHDHRSGIRETIFESETFRNSQFIVTCHSNEFIKDIQNHLPQHSRNDCQLYVIRPHLGNHQPSILRNNQQRNYVLKARALKDELNDRDSLAASRQALELYIEKVWKWMASHEQGTINVQLRDSVNGPSLRNLVDAIGVRLNEAVTFNHLTRQPLIAALDRIRGIPAQNLVWRYINKGTHEEADQDDFDAVHVESVVVTLEEISNLELRPNR